MAKDIFYITTSIPYMNARVHIGHALEVAQADVLARFHRLQEEQVFFLTGTDEHGKKIQEAAAGAGKAPQEFVDEMTAYYKKVCDTLGISYDNLIRTSDKEKHWPVVAGLWRKLQKQGDIYKGSYEGYYCVGCEAFLREAEMKDGVCLIHKKPVQKISEKNYFFRFSKYSKAVERLIREDVIKILPAWRKAEILNLFSEEGSHDISFSRPAASVGWGIPVPDDASQMIYVWADALVNYLSGAGLEASEILRGVYTERSECAQDDKHSSQNDKPEVHSESEFKKRWPADIHLIGKDIARFHLMIWPAILLALELELPRAVYIHGHISVAGQKISKSLGNVVDPLELVEKYGVDAMRYYLLREIPSGDDGDFSFERLRERYVADLQNGLGNLVSRITAAGEKNKELNNIQINDIFKTFSGPYNLYKRHIDQFQFHIALEQVWKLVAGLNQLVDERRIWELPETDLIKAKKAMAIFAENLYMIAFMLLPFMPDTAEKIFGALNITIDAVLESREFIVVFKKPEQPLFPRLK